MLSQKTFPLFLLALALLTNLYLWGQAARAWLVYLPLKVEVPVKVAQWQIEEVSSDQFALRAIYNFDWQGDAFCGEARLAKPYYLNQFAAVAAIRSAAQASWTAWIDPTDPRRSAIDRAFPLSFLIRSIIATGVLFYFIYILNKNNFVIGSLINKA